MEPKNDYIRWKHFLSQIHLLGFHGAYISLPPVIPHHMKPGPRRRRRSRFDEKPEDEPTPMEDEAGVKRGLKL
jgi:hypothetical protein